MLKEKQFLEKQVKLPVFPYTAATAAVAADACAIAVVIIIIVDELQSFRSVHSQ